MDTLFAPWRMEYLVGEKVDGCIFCKCSVRCDEFVLYEGKNVFVMMNKYPYVNGHLMIIPNRHVGKYEDLSQEERREMFNLLETALKALREVPESLWVQCGHEYRQGGRSGSRGAYSSCM